VADPSNPFSASPLLGPTQCTDLQAQVYASIVHHGRRCYVHFITSFNQPLDMLVW
jgi:hypothetical protein